jgi:molybdopterin-guanine dinucleotide biosynthesis protein A
MGQDKSLLFLGGRLLIDHAMRRFKTFQCDIFIVGPKARFNAFGRVVEDDYTDKGPLAGIHAALKRSETEFNLISAVDVPLIPATFFELVLDAMRHSDAEVIVPKAAGGIHPLCGVYRKSFVSTAESALKANRLKIDEVIRSRPHQIYEAEENGFTTEQFLNVNSPADLDEAERLYADAQARAAKHQ